MIDAKIPKEERDSILLLADGPEIWWVVGYRRGESGRVGKTRKQFCRYRLALVRRKTDERDNQSIIKRRRGRQTN